MKILVVNGAKDYAKELTKRITDAEVINIRAHEIVESLEDRSYPTGIDAIIFMLEDAPPKEELSEEYLDHLLIKASFEEFQGFRDANPDLFVAALDWRGFATFTPDHELDKIIRNAAEEVGTKLGIITSKRDASPKENNINVIGKFHCFVAESLKDSSIIKVIDQNDGSLFKESIRIKKIRQFNEFLWKTGFLNAGDPYVDVPEILDFDVRPSGYPLDAKRGYSLLEISKISGKSLLEKMGVMNRLLFEADKTDIKRIISQKMRIVSQVIMNNTRFQALSLYLPNQLFDDVHCLKHYTETTEKKFIGDIEEPDGKRFGLAALMDPSDKKAFESMKRKVMPLNEPIFKIIGSSKKGRYLDRSPINILLSDSGSGIKVKNIDHGTYRNYPLELEFGQTFNLGMILSDGIGIITVEDLVFNDTIVCKTGDYISEKAYAIFENGLSFNYELKELSKHLKSHGQVPEAGFLEDYFISDFEDYRQLVLAGGIYRSYMHFSACTRHATNTSPVFWQVAFDCLSSAIEDVKALAESVKDGEDKLRLKDLRTFLSEYQEEHSKEFSRRGSYQE